MLPMIGMMAIGSLMGGGGKSAGNQISVSVPITNNPINYQPFNPVNNNTSPYASTGITQPSSIAPTISQPITASQDQRGGADPSMGLASPNAAYIADSSAPAGSIDDGIFGGNILIYAAIAGVLVIIIMRKKS